MPTLQEKLAAATLNARLVSAGVHPDHAALLAEKHAARLTVSADGDVDVTALASLSTELATSTVARFRTDTPAAETVYDRIRRELREKYDRERTTEQERTANMDRYFGRDR